ncbi:hypothetical protein A4D02_09460 [Niastella koreensis]|uniref:Uncharacterized protein n=2 Tax=Niastella koreensis TaxID=354356 RepID=G8TM03_NIAKG|nr:RteC domain-containing protein [Niastella koreensis]AEV98763.1 hypothetical protein Niako_2421 [Niastella koreensis GR20-10]OQP43701.1 hypothetical protein A4D02_09460 [Niastella koreensis]
MKNSLLMQQCRLIYKRIQQDIQSHGSQLPDEIKYIEWGFGATLQAWLSIEKITEGYPFRDQQEEVCFYKSQKPRFTGLIDYFNLLYKSILFQPEDCTKWEDYWKRELHTCMDAIARFTIACLNYQQQQPDTDLYFLQHNNQQTLLFGSNVSTFDFQRTSYSCLLGRLIALKKYKKYIQEKICIRIPLRQIA